MLEGCCICVAYGNTYVTFPFLIVITDLKFQELFSDSLKLELMAPWKRNPASRLKFVLPDKAAREILVSFFFILSLLSEVKLSLAVAVSPVITRMPANKKDNEKVCNMLVICFIVSQMYKLFYILYNKFLTKIRKIPKVMLNNLDRSGISGVINARFEKYLYLH